MKLCSRFPTLPWMTQHATDTVIEMRWASTLVEKEKGRHLEQERQAAAVDVGQQAQQPVDRPVAGPQHHAGSAVQGGHLGAVHGVMHLHLGVQLQHRPLHPRLRILKLGVPACPKYLLQDLLTIAMSADMGCHT